MVDTGPPALPLPPAGPTPQASQALQQPIQPVQPPVDPHQSVPTQPVQNVPQLNWSHFKPEFSGKPEEDAAAHLLKTNNCMDTHAFQQCVKVQRFCLILVGEARL